MVCVALLFGAAAVAAEKTSSTRFHLEAAKDGARFGPYEYRQGLPIAIGDAVYIVSIPASGQIEFVSADTGERFGPYDLVAGRLVRLGGGMYAIADMSEAAIETPAPAAATVPETVRPAPAATPAPVRQEPAPARKPADTVAPSRTAPAPAARAVPPAQPAAASARTLPFILGAGVMLLDQTPTDWEIGDVVLEDSVPLLRNTLFLLAGIGRVEMQLGFVYDARMDDTLDGTETLFDDARLRNGSGWWLRTAGTLPVLKHADGWFADLEADVLYRSEEYDLTYNAWRNKQVTVAATSTNTEDQVVTLWQYGSFAETMSLSELSVSLGGRTGYRGDDYAGYVGLRFLAFSRMQIDADVVTSQGEYAVDLDRSGAASLVAGGEIVFAGLQWFTEAEIGSAQRIGIGCRRSF